MTSRLDNIIFGLSNSVLVSGFESGLIQNGKMMSNLCQTLLHLVPLQYTQTIIVDLNGYLNNNAYLLINTILLFFKILR